MESYHLDMKLYEKYHKPNTAKTEVKLADEFIQILADDFFKRLNRVGSIA